MWVIKEVLKPWLSVTTEGIMFKFFFLMAIIFGVATTGAILEGAATSDKAILGLLFGIPAILSLLWSWYFWCAMDGQFPKWMINLEKKLEGKNAN
jgi:hypothetical protein